MFHLYQSNKVEVLLAQLIRLLLEQKVAPLQSQTVVVENPGLAHWLKMQLAHSLGIAANVNFPMPSRFFWDIQRELQPDLDTESVFSKDTLAWLVMESLNDEALIEQPSFDLLKTYLSQSDGSFQQDELKRYQLASNIADLYDQYLVYRPDWIENWEQGLFEFDGAPLAEHQWQGEFWQYLLQKAEAKGLPTHHRGNLVRDFLSLLAGEGNGQNVDFSILPSDVIFFGFSTLPNHQIEALKLLSKHTNVHLLTPNPCEHYWGDVVDDTVQAKLRLRGKDVSLMDAGNDLLASLGGLGKDYQRMLLDVEDVQEHSLFVASEDNHMLAHIQNQILHLQQPSDHPLNWESHDQSIHVVGCHSPMREIEVLHDHLLDVFSTQSIEPQEMVVMIPDVASYAPYIDAVFNHSDPKIPYSISDRPVQAEHPLLSAFLGVLDIPKGRLTFSDVTSLIEIPAVCRAYGLHEQHIPQLKDWLVEAGVRWGFDEIQRQQQGLPKWQQNTWLYGFKRLLMGYAMGTDTAFEGIAPITSVEGLDAQWLGPLMDFVNDIHAFSEQVKESRTAADWSGFILNMVGQFFQPDDAEQPVMEHIYQALEAWVTMTQKVNYGELIAFAVLADGLNRRLQASGGSQHFMVGKVNFCTLLPMRSIPFKMVAVLGLNDADYPRSVVPNSLDLMRFKRRLGDRSRRDEDRYLFLEALLSARDSLWLSYKSRDQKEDKPLTPSVVLAELMDYLANADQDRNFFTQHPLQPFNAQYFSSKSTLSTYNHDWLAVHDNRDNTQSDDEPILEDEYKGDVLIEDLVQFFQHPSKYYLNNVLNVNLSSWADQYDDDEPFSLDGLAQFQLKNRLLTQNLQGQEESHVTLAEGHLAYGEIGMRQWKNIEAGVAPVLEQAKLYTQEAPLPPFEMQVPFKSHGVKLLGWQKQVIGHNLLMVLPNKLSAKILLPLIINMACLSAMGSRCKGVLICMDHVVTLQPMDRSLALNYLEGLVDLFNQGQTEPLAFLAETAWQLVRPNKQGGRSYNNQLHSQNAFWGVSGPFGRVGEREDIHHQRCIDDLNDIPSETLELSDTVFGPWIELMEIVAHDA